jgi:CBS domain containing-hemolysin-like protein
MAANKHLKVFVEEKKNVALVVYEFGGTSGMVTIEDVLEEIVGDIDDEHDVNELTEKVLSNNDFIFPGRLEIDYLNEKYHFNLPEEDDYKTLAGMILFFVKPCSFGFAELTLFGYFAPLNEMNQRTEALKISIF